MFFDVAMAIPHHGGFRALVAGQQVTIEADGDGFVAHVVGFSPPYRLLPHERLTGKIFRSEKRLPAEIGNLILADPADSPYPLLLGIGVADYLGTEDFALQTLDQLRKLARGLAANAKSESEPGRKISHESLCDLVTFAKARIEAERDFWNDEAERWAMSARNQGIEDPLVDGAEKTEAAAEPVAEGVKG